MKISKELGFFQFMTNALKRIFDALKVKKGGRYRQGKFAEDLSKNARELGCDEFSPPWMSTNIKNYDLRNLGRYRDLEKVLLRICEKEDLGSDLVLSKPGNSPAPSQEEPRYQSDGFWQHLMFETVQRGPDPRIPSTAIRRALVICHGQSLRMIGNNTFWAGGRKRIGFHEYHQAEVQDGKEETFGIYRPPRMRYARHQPVYMRGICAGAVLAPDDDSEYPIYACRSVLRRLDILTKNASTSSVSEQQIDALRRNYCGYTEVSELKKKSLSRDGLNSLPPAQREVEEQFFYIAELVGELEEDASSGNLGKQIFLRPANRRG